MQDKFATLRALCQVAGIIGAGLIAPCYLVDLTFNADFLSILAQAMLSVFALAAIAAVWVDNNE